jgi:lipopolysaccharide export system protein LptA
MYTQSYLPKNPGKYTLLIAALVFSHSAWPLSTDKDQPIEIEANAAELDDQKGVTVYTGNVVVTQGSIRMTGDKMTVYYTKDNDLDTVIMLGQPATYRQLPDKSEVNDEAEALRMEFYNLKNLIVLIDNALVTQEGLRFSGGRIEYDTENSKIRARGAPDKSVTEDGVPTQDSGRVKITIQPKKKE